MIRQDYLLRLIEELGRFVRELSHLRSAGRHEEALLRTMQAQEQLFGGSAAAQAALTPAEQVIVLTRDEPPRVAGQKCLAHATLLTESARTYRARDAHELADGALLAALEIAAAAAEQFPVALADFPPEVLPGLVNDADAAGLDSPALHALRRQLEVRG